MANATAVHPRFEFDRVTASLMNGKARQMRLVSVTPELAADLLNRNKRNRPLKASTVARYAKDLTDGRWRSTAQPVVIDWNGDLLDGQHRLWACVETGISFIAYIATGEDPDTFAAYDRGSKRTGADALAVLGYKNRHCLAATASRLRRHQRGATWSTTAEDKYVNVEEQVEVVEEFPGITDSVLVGAAVNGRRLASPSLAAFLHYLFAEIDADAASAFFEKLTSGAGLTETDSVFHLRERLVRNSQDTKAKIPQKEVAALIIKAWNARGKRVRSLRWRSSGDKQEAFPEIR